MEVCDCIVVGLGGHGSAAIAQIAQSGLKVLGFEKYSRLHDQGSSHGRSRIIRQAYYEDPRYVPLLKRSFELWEQLVEEQKSLSVSKTGVPPEESLLNMTGGMMIGARDSVVIQGTLKSTEVHQLPHEVLSHSEINQRFPVMTPDENTIGIFEKKAGYLIPEACIDTYITLAEQHGAELHYGEEIVWWEVLVPEHQEEQEEENRTIIKVVNNQGETFLTRKLVLTVGAGAPKLYGASIPVHLHVERRALFWFYPTPDVDIEEFRKIPVYIWDLGEKGNFYGFPLQSGSPENAVKVAIHISDRQVDRRCTPDTINRVVSEEDIEEIRGLLRGHISSLAGEICQTATCMYTLTPDTHFLIDFHPSSKNVIVASPCSGHGFKFCSVVGEIVKDLVVQGFTSHDISLFSFGIREQ